MRKGQVTESMILWRGSVPENADVIDSTAHGNLIELHDRSLVFVCLSYDVAGIFRFSNVAPMMWWTVDVALGSSAVMWVKTGGRCWFGGPVWALWVQLMRGSGYLDPLKDTAWVCFVHPVWTVWVNRIYDGLDRLSLLGSDLCGWVGFDPPDRMWFGIFAVFDLGPSRVDPDNRFGCLHVDAHARWHHCPISQCAHASFLK